jgi:hypothetical protein
MEKSKKLEMEKSKKLEILFLQEEEKISEFEEIYGKKLHISHTVGDFEGVYNFNFVNDIKKIIGKDTHLYILEDMKDNLYGMCVKENKKLISVIILGENIDEKYKSEKTKINIYL